ncbi:MAG TPA: WG repeat-containing protein [Actinoplanes sp.]
MRRAGARPAQVRPAGPSVKGWGSDPGEDQWDDQPAWSSEVTWEWEPLPGQRYPGDPTRRRAPQQRMAEKPAADEPEADEPESGSGPSNWFARPRRTRVAPPPSAPPSAASSPAAPERPDAEPTLGQRVAAALAEGQGHSAPPAGPDDPQPASPTRSVGASRELRTARAAPNARLVLGVAAGPASDPATDVLTAAVPTADTVLPAPETVTGAASALRAPTMLTPVVIPGGRRATPESPHPSAPRSTPEGTPAEPDGPADATARRRAPVTDPEQVLSAYTWRFHHETLRELVDDPDLLRAVRDGLTHKLATARGDAVRARLLSLRAVVSRILGDLTGALADGREAVGYARATGELRRTAITQARLAHVLQWRGEFAEADRLFAEANSVELPDRLRATMHEHAGRSCYDQGRYIEACNHFEKALDLRKVEDPELIARTVTALDAVLAQVRRKGWGPYPRSRDEILQRHRPPVPAFDEQVQCWGYVDTAGAVAVPPRYADAQPFRAGVAWVRRPETRAWELIDESGAVLIDASAGFLGAGSFSDGLAWVSRDGTGGWFAIDRQGKPVVTGGFDDVRPFRRGLAAVRRGGWGAVDRTGRVVVQFRYRAFATALVDGRYVEGFTDEGLAIVDAGDRKGVVDRTGQLVVPPVHAALVIHPVAFLIGDRTGRWGALDRHGEPLIDVVHAGRGAVIDEIDRLLADTKPVL